MTVVEMSSPPLAYDFAEWHTPDATAAKNAGYVAGIGYASSDPSKNLTPGEAGTMHMAGLGVGIVFENGASDALQGATLGQAHGQQFAGFLKAIGFQPGCACWINIGDFAATPDQIPSIHAYYEAVKGSLWPYATGLGGYGTGYIIDQLVGLGSTGLWWQNAMNDQGEVGSVVSVNAWLYQRVSPTLVIPGGGYDEDPVVNGRTIPWWAETPTPVPTPVPPPPPPIPGPAPTPIPVPPARRNIFTPLAVDGIFGVRSTQAEQFVSFNGNTAACDGIFGPASKRSLQAHLGVKPDGIIGPVTVDALQRRVGDPVVDGSWGPKTTEYLQMALNGGRY